MRKVTTTTKINGALTNNLVKAEKVEVYYKTSGKTEIMDTNKFTENFSFLCESGIFLDAVGWHYKRDIETNGYIAETGRMNPDTEVVITVYLGICNGACKENIEKALLFLEEEQIITRDSKTKMYIVRSLELTNWLCGQGYKILKVEDSEKNPKYKIFLFEDTKQIRNSVAKFLLQKEVQPN